MSKTDKLLDNQQQRRILAFFISAAIYTAFAVYLYLPYLNRFASNRRFLIPAALLAAAGTYLLSTRWLFNPLSSFFAGVFYAFTPFSLGFALYHPAASLLYAVIPWLFIPAAMWPHKPFKGAYLVTIVLSILPFAAIIVFFTAAAYYRFFPVPKMAKLSIEPFMTFITPLLLKPNEYPFISIYHVAIAPFIFGLLIFLRLHRIGAILVCILGLVLAFMPPVGQTSPIIWAALPVLCLAIVAGIGLEALAVASGGDKTSLAHCTMIMIGFAVAAALLAVRMSRSYMNQEKAQSAAFTHAALWYLAAGLVTFMILILASKERRSKGIRLGALSILLAADIFISARIAVDTLF